MLVAIAKVMLETAVTTFVIMFVVMLAMPQSMSYIMLIFVGSAMVIALLFLVPNDFE